MSTNTKHTPGRIEVEIEQLVLEGFDARDSARIRAAVERELGSLLMEEGAPGVERMGGSVAHIDAGSFQMGPLGNPEKVGTQIAARLHGRLHGGIKR